MLTYANVCYADAYLAALRARICGSSSVLTYATHTCSMLTNAMHTCGVASEDLRVELYAHRTRRRVQQRSELQAMLLRCAHTAVSN
jgi:hypothetical protein